MFNYDANNAYSIINARHEDIRNAEEARRFAKAEQGESTSGIVNMVKGENTSPNIIVAVNFVIARAI